MKKFLFVMMLVGCSNPPSAATVKTAETDFCAARAAYKAFAATQGGKLDPAPGSPRAKLEAEEDKLCAVVGK